MGFLSNNNNQSKTLTNIKFVCILMHRLSCLVLVYEGERNEIKFWASISFSSLVRDSCEIQLDLAKQKKNCPSKKSFNREREKERKLQFLAYNAQAKLVCEVMELWSKLVEIIIKILIHQQVSAKLKWCDSRICTSVCSNKSGLLKWNFKLTGGFVYRIFRRN